ncbi:MAG: hypothetical protein FWF79_04090 [Defluviitaleaceae bacterium]|nr:hypothetical protein [Defluviitaleaceae bacterium]
MAIATSGSAISSDIPPSISGVGAVLGIPGTATPSPVNGLTMPSGAVPGIPGTATPITTALSPNMDSIFNHPFVILLIKSFQSADKINDFVTLSLIFLIDTLYVKGLTPKGNSLSIVLHVKKGCKKGKKNFGSKVNRSLGGKFTGENPQFMGVNPFYVTQ